MNIRYLFFSILIIIGLNSLAQDLPETMTAGVNGIISKPVLVPSISKQIAAGTFKAADPDAPARSGQPKRRGSNMVVPGKGLPVDGDALVKEQALATRFNIREPELIFNANVSNYTPSDPTGAAGPNHFVGGWNVGFRVFDKSGNPLTPAASLSTLFPGNNLGDPIVLYDKQADRFIITEFDSSPNGFNVAISQGPDPVNDDWYIYTTGFTTGSFPDYPKFSIWSDGYYVTANIYNNNRLFVIHRDSVIAGSAAPFIGFPLPGIRTSGFYSPQVFSVSNGDLPPAGNATVVYMQDDAWSGVSVDHLKLWTVNVDWDNPSNSTISAAQELVTTPFVSVFDGGSFSNRPQPSGPDQDVLQATIMNQAQYRRFPDYNSAIFNFVVDVAPGNAELAGIRWYELRQYGDGEPWEIFQEGTYTSPYNGKDAFSASMVMDGDGNIGMAYTTVSSTERIAVYHTGRYASDPPGVMTIDETLIAQSNTNNPSSRLADYVHMTLDPADDKTFWHIAEFFNNGGRTDVVGVFRLAPTLANDISMVSIESPTDGALSDAETVTVSLFNAGQSEQTDLPVQLLLDDELVVTEIIPGPIPSASSFTYSFNTTLDLSTEGSKYQITVINMLEGDAVPENDTITKTVQHLYQNDIGIAELINPVNGSLPAFEKVAINLHNFGTLPQTNFEVGYVLDDALITALIDDTLQGGQSMSYQFEELADFSQMGIYELTTFTSLPTDSYPDNDTLVTQIEKNICQPESSCNYGMAIQLVEIGDISNHTDCSESGYSNFSTLSTKLEKTISYPLVIGTGYGDMFIKVWIDFNDNYVFEPNELLIDNYRIAPNQGMGTYIDTLELLIPENAELGNHIMRIKSSWNQYVPNDACASTIYGETEDYMVDVTLFTSAPAYEDMLTDLMITPLSEKQYIVELEASALDETLIFNLYDIKGHILVENRVNPVNGKYSYMLDMSYAKSGVYLIRMGSYKFGKVRRLVVP